MLSCRRAQEKKQKKEIYKPVTVTVAEQVVLSAPRPPPLVKSIRVRTRVQIKPIAWFQLESSLAISLGMLFQMYLLVATRI